MPAGSQFAIASRGNLRLPAARLRAQGRIEEISADDLAMGQDGGDRAARRRGGRPRGPATSKSSCGGPKGWPAGLYLAALAMKAGSPRAEAGFSFTGDDHYMGDYLRFEFLDRVSRSEATFLTRTSILDRMCGPLCDATLGRKGSTRVLEQLESRNLLVVPLDRRREWYRYHQLFRELLYAELKRREPDTIPKLHARAAEWYEANAMPETAIEHAQAAGDANLVARLVLNMMQPVWASGRVDTVLGLDGLARGQDLGRALCRHRRARGLDLRPARPAGRSRTLGGGGRTGGHPTESCPTATPLAGTLAYLRAILCRHGVGEMRRDAQIALAGLSPASPYRATMLLTEGISYLLGARSRTGPIRSSPTPSTSPPAPVLCPWWPWSSPSAASWPPNAMTGPLPRRSPARPSRSWRTATSTTTGRAHWCTRGRAGMAARNGDVAGARQYVARAARLRPLLTYALPVVSAQALLELARAYLALGDSSGAQSRAAAGPGHLSATTRPRRPAGRSRPTASHAGHNPDRNRRGIVAHHRRATAAASAVHPPHPGRDQPAPVRVAKHGQDPGDRDLPEVRCLLPPGSDWPHAPARPALPRIAPGGPGTSVVVVPMGRTSSGAAIVPAHARRSSRAHRPNEMCHDDQANLGHAERRRHRPTGNPLAMRPRQRPERSAAAELMASFVPGVAMLRSYRAKWLSKDLIAGLILTALLVPQGMAYAELAGLPPITGLYTSILCLVGYALFGPSKILVLGPDSSLGPMIAATILPLVGAHGDPAQGGRPGVGARAPGRGDDHTGRSRAGSGSSPTSSPSPP